DDEWNTVTVTAQDDQASEYPDTDTGTFRVLRTGTTANALTVFFTLSGTATQGTDYQPIGTSVTIPAGQSSADITLTAIDDSLVEGNETAILTLSSSADYTVGSPAPPTADLDDERQTVTVTAQDNQASENPNTDTGTFRVWR